MQKCLKCHGFGHIKRDCKSTDKKEVIALGSKEENLKSDSVTQYKRNMDTSEFVGVPNNNVVSPTSEQLKNDQLAQTEAENVPDFKRSKPDLSLSDSIMNKEQ